MSHETLLGMPALAMTMAASGFVFGLAYFAVLRRTATSFATGRRLAALVFTLGRIGAAVLFLGLAAKLGAASLLAAFAGFLLARMLALRGARSAF
jgi:N-ATPase, AtpR subunit